MTKAVAIKILLRRKEFLQSRAKGKQFAGGNFDWSEVQAIDKAIVALNLQIELQTLHDKEHDEAVSCV